MLLTLQVVGIDLGTTNSAVAAMEGGKPTIVTNVEGGLGPPLILMEIGEHEGFMKALSNRCANTGKRGSASVGSSKMRSDLLFWSLTVPSRASRRAHDAFCGGLHQERRPAGGPDRQAPGRGQPREHLCVGQALYRPEDE